MKKKKQNRFFGRMFLFWFVTLVVLELTLHLVVYRSVSYRMLAMLPFILSASVVLMLLSSLFPSERANRVMHYVLLELLFILFGVQVVYDTIFDTLLSLSFITVGGEAVTNFFPVLLRGLSQSWIPLVLIFLFPLVLLGFLHRRDFLPCAGMTLKGMGASLLFAAALHLIGMVPVWISGDTGVIGGVYQDPYGTIDRQCEYFGLLTAERLELWRLIRGDAGLSGADLDLSNTEPDVVEETISTSNPASARNIMTELDFAGLNLLTDDKKVQELNDYFAGLTGTKANDYTGMFSGYNLIQVCAESYTPSMVDPELTPTLYKLTHEGFLFENFYTSFPSMTTNGEYSLCMGLMPDMSRVSFSTSMDNYVPFCLGNRFSETGATAYAYHNNIATFYNRINTHSNMGYTFKAVNFGLDMEKGSPSSDLEMMEKTVDDYIQEKQFVVHYMTYSGHGDYNFEENDMSIKNRDRVQNLDCSEELKAFYACQLELEDAMAYLLRRLEEAGIAERTVIVLTGDHYPYCLSAESYEELAGEAVEEDPWWRYRNSFVCWSGSMTEPVTVAEYCCTQDILPTMLNLFGIPYESRLLTGMDVLSDSLHVAILQDGSFLTTALTYNASDGMIGWREPEENYPSGFAQELIRTVRNEFSVSASILRNDYYRFVFTSLGLLDPTAEVREHFYSYEDIDGAWYAEDVEILTGCGVLTGKKGTFNGDETASRSDFLVMLARAMELKPSPETEIPFTDVPDGAWYASYLASAYKAGIVNAEDTNFRANDDITLDELRDFFSAAAIAAGIPEGDKWAAGVVNNSLERAESAEYEQETPTRGFIATVIAPLTVELETE